MKSMMASLALLALVLSGCSDDAAPKPVCGDSKLEAPEACDDGNTMPGDGCDASCVVEFCGDSVTNNTTEACDDGNEIEGDGCDSTCLETGCGSGVKTPGELCFGEVTALTLGASPQGVVLADFNGDEHLDAAVTGLGQTVYLLFGDGTGALAPHAELTAAADRTGGIDSADFNEDGHMDLVVASSDTSLPGKISVFLNSGTGTFTGPVAYDTRVFPRAFLITDLDGDDNLDLVIAAQNSSVIQRFFGDGSGAFTAATDIALPSPITVIGGDFNGDGAVDLVARQNGFSDFKIFLNLDDGSGDFAAPVSVDLDGPVGDIRAFDFDADGHLDLAVNVGGSPNQVVLFENDGAAAFTPMAAFSVATNSTGLAIEDLDGDGRVELIQLEYSATSYYIFAGQGGFAFADAQIFPATFPASFDVGDLNGDGLKDLVLANQGGTLRISLFNP